MKFLLWLASIVSLVLVTRLSNNLVIAGEIDCHLVEQVCSNSKTHYFYSTQKIRDVLEAIEQNKCDNLGSCKSRYESSLRLLSDLISNEVLNDICIDSVYDKIRNFHDRFISIYGPEANKEQLEFKAKNLQLELIPESLRRFFIIFALQVNAACERQLVARLGNGELDKLVTDEDFRILSQFKYEQSRTFGYTYLERARRFKDLKILSGKRLPKDSKSRNAIEEGNGVESEPEKLYMEVRFGDNIKMVKDACKYKFKPIYDELFTQVIKLNNLGYMDHVNTVRERGMLNEEKHITRWYEIIENCELMKDVEVIQDTSSNSAVRDLIRAASYLTAPSANTVTLLTKEEFKAAEKRVADRVAKDGDAYVYKIKDGEEYVYKVSDGEGYVYKIEERVKIEHKALKFTPRMYLQSDSEQAAEVKDFERRVEKLISKETNFFSLLVRDTNSWLRRNFHKSKLQFKNKDETSAIGKIASFMDRHKVAIRVVGTFIGIIVITAHFAG